MSVNVLEENTMSESSEMQASPEITTDTTGVVLPRIGEVFPDYPSFCKAMGEKPLTSNAKIAQVKRWRARMKIAVVGRTWRILEVYGKEEIERMEVEERRGREKNLNEKTHKGENLSGFFYCLKIRTRASLLPRPR
jgi:hypothetical protein